MDALEITGDDLSTRQLNKEIKKAINNDQKNVVVKNIEEKDSIAVGLGVGNEIVLEGKGGDFVAALNNGAYIEIKGDVGRYVGDNMTSGEIIIHGSADDGVGFGIYNGTIVVYGNAGNAVGQLNKGGTIIIQGDMGDLAGLYMLSGDIIVTGNAGKYTGDWMIGGTIYVAGEFEAGTNAAYKELDLEDKQKLTALFKKYNIDAKADDFTKIEPKVLRPFYGNNSEDSK